MFYNLGFHKAIVSMQISQLVGMEGGVEKLLATRPELSRQYAEFFNSFSTTDLLPARALEILRLRISWVHGASLDPAILATVREISEEEAQGLFSASSEESLFSDADRSVMAIADTLPLNHHQLSDAQVVDLGRHLGTPGVVALLVAAAFYDVQCRMQIALSLPPDGLLRS